MQVVIEDVVLERAVQKIVTADLQSGSGVFAREVQGAIAEIIKSKALSDLVKEKMAGLIPTILERMIAETVEDAIKAKVSQTLRKMMESGEMASAIRKTLDQANG